MPSQTQSMGDYQFKRMPQALNMALVMWSMPENCKTSYSRTWTWSCLRNKGMVIRYVGVIWFLFHVLQLLPIRFTQQNSCCINKSTIKHLQNSNWHLDLPRSSYAYQNCMFVGFLIGYTVLLIIFIIECRAIINIWIT